MIVFTKNTRAVKVSSSPHGFQILLVVSRNEKEKTDKIAQQ